MGSFVGDDIERKITLKSRGFFVVMIKHYDISILFLGCFVERISFCFDIETWV